MTEFSKALVERALARPNCWLCGEYGHTPAPNCLMMYEVRRARTLTDKLKG